MFHERFHLLLREDIILAMESLVHFCKLYRRRNCEEFDGREYRNSPKQLEQMISKCLIRYKIVMEKIVLLKAAISLVRAEKRQEAP